MKAILDRFEGDIAVLVPQREASYSMPKTALPQDAANGDTVELVKGRWIIDREDTAERRKRITEKRTNCSENNSITSGGNLDRNHIRLVQEFKLMLVRSRIRSHSWTKVIQSLYRPLQEEMTGSLDDQILRALHDRLVYLPTLSSAR